MESKPKFKVGDKVLITKNLDDFDWAKPYVRTVGVVVEVVGLGGCEVRHNDGTILVWYTEELVPVGELSEALYSDIL